MTGRKQVEKEIRKIGLEKKDGITDRQDITPFSKL